MAGSIAKLCERMRYWCEDANLGYCQQHRWDIRIGGECDCSSLTIHSLMEAGFDVGDATYTGDLSDKLCARGWERIAPDISGCRPGDILLNDGCHVCVVIAGYGWDAIIAQASINEFGGITGGEPGDQTDGETNTRGVYMYSRGWDCILRYTGADGGSGGEISPSTPTNALLAIDAKIGPKSVSEWQRQRRTVVDGVVSGQIHDCRHWYPNLTSVTYEENGSALMKSVQAFLGVPNPSGIIAGGTVALMQGRLILWGYDLGDARLGVLDDYTAKAVQRSLNDGMWAA